MKKLLAKFYIGLIVLGFIAALLYDAYVLNSNGSQVAVGFLAFTLIILGLCIAIEQL